MLWPCLAIHDTNVSLLTYWIIVENQILNCITKYLTDLHTVNILFTVIAVEYTASLLKLVVQTYGDLLVEGYTKIPTRNINVENKRATKRNERNKNIDKKIRCVFA
jgi:hypothetical protein